MKLAAIDEFINTMQTALDELKSAMGHPDGDSESDD